MKYLILIMMLVLIPFASAYYVGYGAFGMNHTAHEELLSKIPVEYFEGLTSIEFTNCVCVYTEIIIEEDGYQMLCSTGYFNYWYGRTRIRMARFHDLNDMINVLLHELVHLQQWRNNQPLDEEEAYLLALEWEVKFYEVDN